MTLSKFSDLNLIFIKRKHCYFNPLNISFFKLITMNSYGDFSGELYIKSLQCVQLERTTLGCMEHRKQMPFLSAATTTDIEQLSPLGVLLIHERCLTFSCNQLFWILHQNNLNTEKKVLLTLQPTEIVSVGNVIKITNF